MDISVCTSPELSGILYTVKSILTIIQMVAPILLIIMLAIHLIKLAANPDNEKKMLPKLKNSIIALFIIFLIPTIASATMYILGTRTELSTCWNQAEKPNSNVNYYYETNENRTKKFLQNSNDYEKGKKTGGTAGAANSTHDKKDYSNGDLNVVKAVDTNINNPKSNIGNGRNVYRATQAGCYTGKYAVYSMNKNYGSIDESSKGGRICWSDISTGKQVKCIEIGSEGGHMDGLAYDNDRGVILKTGKGNLIVIDNQTKQIIGHSNISEIHVGITYVPYIHMLVGYSGGSLKYYKYNPSNNTYEKQGNVNLQNWNGDSIQGIGTDGTNIFIADSSPDGGKRALYTYSLKGEKLEERTFGSGFGSMSDEVEAAFADNAGNLYLVCPQGIGRVTNYRANRIGLTDNS